MGRNLFTFYQYDHLDVYMMMQQICWAFLHHVPLVKWPLGRRLTGGKGEGGDNIGKTSCDQSFAPKSAWKGGGGRLITCWEGYVRGLGGKGAGLSRIGYLQILVQKISSSSYKQILVDLDIFRSCILYCTRSLRGRVLTSSWQPFGPAWLRPLVVQAVWPTQIIRNLISLKRNGKSPKKSGCFATIRSPVALFISEMSPFEVILDFCDGQRSRKSAGISYSRSWIWYTMCWNTSLRNAINVKGAEEVRFILKLGDTKNPFSQFCANKIQKIVEQNYGSMIHKHTQSKTNSKECGTKIWGGINIQTPKDKLRFKIQPAQTHYFCGNQYSLKLVQSYDSRISSYFLNIPCSESLTSDQSGASSIYRSGKSVRSISPWNALLSRFWSSPS